MTGDEASDGLSIPLMDLIEGTIVSRPNRFVAVVRLPDGDVNAHVADSGRLKELVFPGNRALVRAAGEATGGGGGARRPSRTTSYDLVLTAFSGGLWVAVDTRYPNRLFGQAVKRGALREFAQYRGVQPEYSYHLLSPWKEELARTHSGARNRQGQVRSRMDFFLTVDEEAGKRRGDSERGLEGDLEGGSEANAGSGPTHETCANARDSGETGCGGGSAAGIGVPPGTVEVKSVTLCRDGVGLFPDAPTERGRRHLRELMKAAEHGYRAFGVFIAQRSDVEAITPNWETDPDFAEAMKEAQDRGVTFLGFRCSVTPTSIRLDPRPIPVLA